MEPSEVEPLELPELARKDLMARRAFTSAELDLMALLVFTSAIQVINRLLLPSQLFNCWKNYCIEVIKHSSLLEMKLLVSAAETVTL